jgi:hypothetical protein
VGVSSSEAIEFANAVKQKLGDNALIIYYPYFVADKSGTLLVSPSGFIIEAVNKDLWNLVSNNDRDITYAYENGQLQITGNKYFLSTKEIEELNLVERRVRGSFRDSLLEGKSILLEWSYAVESSPTKEKIGKPYLVFYECRTV